MEYVREQDRNGMQREFRKQFLAAQKKRAEAAREKQAVQALKKAAARAQLEVVNLRVVQDEIGKLNVNELKEQVKYYREILGDEALQKVALSKL